MSYMRFPVSLTLRSRVKFDCVALWLKGFQSYDADHSQSVAVQPNDWPDALLIPVLGGCTAARDITLRPKRSYSTRNSSLQ
jgi:hypothetical protein